MEFAVCSTSDINEIANRPISIPMPIKLAITLETMLDNKLTRYLLATKYKSGAQNIVFIINIGIDHTKILFSNVRSTLSA